MSVLLRALRPAGRPRPRPRRAHSGPALAPAPPARRDNYVTFERQMESRRAQARRSVVVQVGSTASCKELVAYCNTFGQVGGVHHYTMREGEQHFMLVEFEKESDVTSILHTGSSHRKDMDVMPINTPFLWFKAANGKTPQKLQHNNVVPLMTINGCEKISEEVLFGHLHNCETISQQIEAMYNYVSLNDLGVRLRYMVARQVEVVFQNLYANIAVRPFGSSVNGFGKMGCDLDIVLTNILNDESKGSESRLIFHTKKSAVSGTRQWQRHMEVMGELLQLYMPGCTRVRRILQARVPIIKYEHDYTGVECDLTISNMSGVYMSELLYLYGWWDARVRPLVFAIRAWAHNTGLTNPSPGRWITNFPLTLMVLFFLQQDVKGGPVLPPLKYLVQRARKEDIRLTEDQINCTFLRDISKIPSQDFSTNKSNLESLLLQFFEFYSQFDFQDKAISINEGAPIRKPNHTALYIVNPLEQTLNVSRNVSFEECERIKVEVRNAAWQLESNLDGEKKSNWGLIELIEKKSTRAIKDLVRVGNSHRLVTVSDLFEDEDSQKVEFKNKQVEAQVKKIKEVSTESKKLLSDVKSSKRTLRKR